MYKNSLYLSAAHATTLLCALPHSSFSPPFPLQSIHFQVSWCKREVVLVSPKALAPAAPGTPLAARPPPPLTVASLSLRVHTAAANHASEILAASVVHLSGELCDISIPYCSAMAANSVIRLADVVTWLASVVLEMLRGCQARDSNHPP
jgi:hypothetical protein